MARSSKSNGNGGAHGVVFAKGARARRWAKNGVTTSQELKACMSDVIADLCGERMDTRLAGAITTASRALLQGVITEFKYGYPVAKGTMPKARTLALNA